MNCHKIVLKSEDEKSIVEIHRCDLDNCSNDEEGVRIIYMDEFHERAWPTDEFPTTDNRAQYNAAEKIVDFLYSDSHFDNQLQENERIQNVWKAIEVIVRSIITS